MTVGLAQVAPSISQAIYAKKIEVGIGREEALMQQIVRFRALEGSYPNSITDLIDKGYWRSADNDNGFGGSYSFAVDSNKGQISISTTIADDDQRRQYLNNYRHIFRPVDGGSGVVSTTFVMPTTGSMGAPLAVSGNIPVSSTAPAAATNTWWYDTSGSTAVLKVSDGASWKTANAGGSGPTTDNIVTSTTGLPATGTAGELRYVYNSTSGSMNSYVWYNGNWVAYGGANTGTSTGSSGIPSLFSSSRFALLSEYVMSGLTCAWNDGVLATDSSGNFYACSDPAVNNGLLPTGTCANVGRFTYDKAGNIYECQ